MDYTTWKLLHQGAVALSLAGFVARGLGSFSQAPWVRYRITRIVPHGVDTLLLLAAALAVFGWIVSVALTKNPLGALRPLGAVL